MKFDCFMSMLFYITVLVINYLPGHSHMVCDCVTSRVKASMKRTNLFTLMQFATAMNNISKVTTTFLDHLKPDRLALGSWKDLLDKHINNMAKGFTQNYLFKFIDRKVCIKPLVTSPDDHISEHIFCLNPASAVKAIMTKLFGPNYDLDQLNMYSIRLERAPLQTLSAAKLKSISNKYNVIPS
jgi:hypothetical protein